MGILHTGKLQVRPSATMSASELAIHPNDGYDLKLMKVAYQFDVFANCSAEEFNHGSGSSVPATLFLRNECRQGSLEMSDGYWERIGKPKEVKLVCSDSRLLLLSIRNV